MRVFDGIALGKLVALHQDALVFIEQHGLGGSRAAVDAHEAFHHLPRLELRGDEFLRLVALFEVQKLLLGLAQPAAALFLLLFQAADVHVPFQIFHAAIEAHRFVFVLAELHRAQRREILRVLRNQDQRSGIDAFRQGELALFPDLGNVRLPALFHAADVRVRPAQQQHLRPQRIAAREHGQVLLHDGFEERSHQLVGRARRSSASR